MDTIFGFLFVFILNKFMHIILQIIHDYSYQIHIQVMRDKLSWIMSFPFGVKSNIPLTNFLGTSIVNLINFVEYFTTKIN